MSEATCPACGTSLTPASDSVSHLELTRKAPYRMKTVEYVACELCGLVAKLPLPEEAELADYYQNSWQYASGRPGQGRVAEFVQRGAYSWDGAGRFPLKVQGGALVRIGSGTVMEVGSKGQDLARELELFGIHLDAAPGFDAQPQAEGVKRAWLGDGLVEKADHALVIAAHILEHVRFPALFMCDLARLTAEGGYIYVEVPSLRGGLRDVGLCDDLNRNHLWHFGLGALARLGSLAGAVVQLETDLTLPGWPVDRMLVRKDAGDSLYCIGAMQSDIRSEYEKAADFLMEHGENEIGLVGASHSYAQLLDICPALVKFKVFDSFKAGETMETLRGKTVTILPLDWASLGQVSGPFYATTRSYNSYVDLRSWCYRNRPAMKLKTPYANIAVATNEFSVECDLCKRPMNELGARAVSAL